MLDGQADEMIPGTRAYKPIIGLAGGIGSGKSTVASIFAELGVAIISSDRLNHEELNAPEVLETLRRWWGEAIVNTQGQADRDAIRRIVRDDDEQRGRLEALTHPRIAERRNRMMLRFITDPSVKAIVWDSPLLFEAGLAERCDRIVFVESKFDLRLERVKRERGWSREDLERFEKSQKPLDLKKKTADYIVVNNSDRDALRPQVTDVLFRILSGSKDLERD